MIIDAPFFDKYDKLHAELTAYEATEAERRAVAEQLARARANHDHLARRHEMLLSKQRHRNLLIQQCEEHWLYSTTALQPQTWARGGVKGKLERQKAKLDAESRLEPELAQSARELASTLLQPLERRLSELEAVLLRKAIVERERTSMFLTAVNSCPTPESFALRVKVRTLDESLQAMREHVESVSVASASAARVRREFASTLSRMRVGHPAAAAGGESSSPEADASAIEVKRQEAELDLHQALQSLPTSICEHYSDHVKRMQGHLQTLTTLTAIGGGVAECATGLEGDFEELHLGEVRLRSSWNDIDGFVVEADPREEEALNDGAAAELVMHLTERCHGAIADFAAECERLCEVLRQASARNSTELAAARAALSAEHDFIFSKVRERTCEKERGGGAAAEASSASSLV